MTIDWYPIPLPCKFEVTNSDELGINATATELELSRDPNLGLAVSIVAPAMKKNASTPIAGTEVQRATVSLRTRARHEAILRGFLAGPTITTTTTVNEEDQSVSRVRGSAES